MIYVLIGSAITIVDQLTKKWVEKNMTLNQSIDIVKDCFSITYICNKGAAFGIFSKRPKVLAAFTLSSVLWLGHIFSMAFKEKNSSAYGFSLACIAGGAIGNMIDRLKRGYVTDFLHFKRFKKAPIFNFADLFILIGTVVFLMKQIFPKKN